MGSWLTRRPPDSAHPEQPTRRRTCANKAASVLHGTRGLPAGLPVIAATTASLMSSRPQDERLAMTLPYLVQDSNSVPAHSLEPAAVLPGATPLTSPRKVRLTVNLPSDLVEQMRDAVYWNPGLTLAWLVARALRASLGELHAANDGPFPRRAKPLRAGRPRLAGQSMRVQAAPSPPPHAMHEAAPPLRAPRRCDKPEPLVSGGIVMGQTRV